MRLREIDLDDFGCFQHARMDGIGDGLVVVGGPQRAGKTTFMQAVRRLGYGIGTGDDVPPPSDTYRIRTIAEQQGEEYRLSVEGHAEPTFTALDGDGNLEIGDVYGLSPVQYRQLFTISLDELRHVPDGISDQSDLAEILLGAAYGDIGEIPEIEAVFDERACEIGRTTGKPSNKTSKFYSAHQQIEEGIEQRKEAREQVETYYQKQDEHERIEEEIDAITRQLAEHRRKKDRLSVVKSEFERVREWQECQEKLADADLDAARAFPTEDVEKANQLRSGYKTKQEELEKAKRKFREQTERGDDEAYEQKLLDNETEIKEFTREVSGWRTTHQQLQERTDELEKRRANLEDRISTLYAEWGGMLDAVDNVETNYIAQDQLSQIATQHQQADQTLTQKRQEKKRKQKRLDKIEQQLSELDSANDDGQVDTFVRNVGLVAGSAVLVAIGASVVGFVIGGLVGSFLLLVGGLYYLVQNVDLEPGIESEIDSLENKKSSLKSDIVELDVDINAAATEREKAASELESVREQYGLPEGVSPDGLREFHESVVELQKEVSDFRREMSELRSEQDEFETTLQRVGTVVSEMTAFEWNNDEPLERAPALFEKTEKLEDDLAAAKGVTAVRREVDNVEDEVESLLAKTEAVPTVAEGDDSATVESQLDRFAERGEQARTIINYANRRDELESDLQRRMQQDGTRKAFAPIRDDDEDWLYVLEQAVDQHVDQEAVQKAIDEVEETITSTQDELEEARKTKVELEQKLSRLKSDEDITEAEEKIESGRAELRRFGERYAVNRIAQKMTDRLYQRFIEEVADPLIEDASEIFHRVTNEYDGIDHNDDFESLDFEAIRDDDTKLNREELSRATAEQLFLSMRIARIRDIDTSLPVVVDDAMTNFDPAHQRRTLRTLDELAQTNQIFLLTCHPELVDRVAEISESAQYWSLEYGKFDGGFDTPTRTTELLTEQTAPTVSDD